MHGVMKNGWRDPHVGEMVERYWTVATDYFGTQQGIDEYLDDSVEAFPPLTPYKVVAESWKQIVAETWG